MPRRAKRKRAAGSSPDRLTRAQKFELWVGGARGDQRSLFPSDDARRQAWRAYRRALAEDPSIGPPPTFCDRLYLEPRKGA